MVKFALTTAVLIALVFPITAMGQGSSIPSRKATSVVIGTPADTVLALCGKAMSTRQVGRDEHGLLVEWEYPDVIYLMGRRVQGGIEAYRVIKITPRR